MSSPMFFGAYRNHTRLTKDSVDRYAWLDKAKPCGEPRRTILLGQGWELEIREAVREIVA
ncbi:MAG: hypothetical protein Q8L41_10690 [Anaerolineales bacterium]|nr:hypothetical protein [Anaerolineales bacterium]